MLKPFMGEGERFVLILQGHYGYHVKIMVQGRDSERSAFPHLRRPDSIPVVAADEIFLHPFETPLDKLSYPAKIH